MDPINGSIPLCPLSKHSHFKAKPTVFCCITSNTPTKRFLSAKCNILNLQFIIHTVRSLQYLRSRIKLVYTFSKVRGTSRTFLYINIDNFIDVCCCLSNIIKLFPSDTCARQWNTLFLEAVQCRADCWSPTFHSCCLDFITGRVTWDL